MEIVVTSLSPSHTNKAFQDIAVESWKKTGYRIISINHASEIDQLKDYNVEFIEPKRTGIGLFGKHYIPVNEFIEVIKIQGNGLIINSDIIISNLPEMSDKSLIFSRYDFDFNIDDNKLFGNGYDGFYLTQNDCQGFPYTDLCMGQCHWDYWIPMLMIKNNIPLLRSNKPHLLHKKHNVQYNSWNQTCEIFKNELRIEHLNPSHYAYLTIKEKIIDI